MQAFPRVLFDEAHNESWTIRRDVAEAINPPTPTTAAMPARPTCCGTWDTRWPPTPTAR